jgi:thymidylate synthase
VKNSPIQETNKRTGSLVRIAEAPQQLTFDLSDGRIPVPDNRRYFPVIGMVEAEWMWSGTKDPALMMEHYPKIWGDFIEGGEIKAAYGHRWRHEFGRDQIELAIEALKNDPTDRQVCLSAWHPGEDGLGAPNLPKNIPCPAFVHMYIAGGKLNMSVFIRSSDVFVGLPYDIMTYTVLLHKFRNAISDDLKAGVLSITTSHTHLYEKHVDLVVAGDGKDYSFPLFDNIHVAKDYQKYEYVKHEFNIKPGLVI